MSKDSKLPKENFIPPLVKVKKEYSDSDSDLESVSSLVSVTSSQSSSKTDVCPICLCSFKNQESGKPDVCEHKFCLECLLEWSKKTNTCPIDRKVFKSIRVNGQDKKLIKVEDRTQENPFEAAVNDVTLCEICRRSDREDRMLLCDGCDHGFHCECLTPRLNEIPEGNWYCQRCSTRANTSSRRNATAAATSHLRQNLNFVRPMTRTRLSERIRHSVNESRIVRGAYIIVSESESETETETTDDEEDYTDDDEISADETLYLQQDNKIDDAISSAIERALNTPIVFVQRPIGQKRIVRYKRRKRRKRRRQTATKTTLKKDGTKPRRKVIRRKRRRYRRVAARSAPSVQERILNSIQKAQQKQIENNKDINPITLKSIELENLAEKKKEKIRGTVFPKQSQPWFQDNILNEINETDPNIPLSSVMLLKRPSSAEPQRVSSSQDRPTTSSNFLDSLLNSQKVLYAPSSQVKIKRDGSIKLVEDQNQKQTEINKIKKSNKSRIMEDSNVLVTNAPYDPFNPDDDIDDNETNAMNNVNNSNDVNVKNEILDSVENKSKSIKIETNENSRAVSETVATNIVENVEYKEIKRKDETSIKKEQNQSDRKSKENTKIKEESKSSRDRSPYSKRHHSSKTKSRSKSPRTHSSIDNKKLSSDKTTTTKYPVKREHSRSRSSSLKDDQRNITNHFHHNHHHQNSSNNNNTSYRNTSSRTFKKSRSRSRSQSNDRHRKYSRNDERSFRKDERKEKIYSRSRSIESKSVKTRQSPKYSDLIEEMIKEEKQQIIDINAIKLPASTQIKSIKAEPIEQTSAITKTTTTTSTSNKNAIKSIQNNSSLDNRLNQMFKTEPTEEPYDLELEYKNTESNKTTISKPVQQQNEENQPKETTIVKKEKMESEKKTLLKTQENIISAAKLAIKPFYLSKKINKDDYKIIMKKVVTKALEHNKTSTTIIDSEKIVKMVTAYAKKMQLQSKKNIE